LTLVRDGREQNLTVKLAERPARDIDKSGAAGESESPPGQRGRSDGDGILLGLNVRDVDRQTAEKLELPRDTRGVLITRVEPMSSSFDGGIDRGTVLLEINRQRIDTVAEFRRIARAARPGDILTLYLYSPDLEQRQLKTVRVDER
jgi:serine protease Do